MSNRTPQTIRGQIYQALFPLAKLYFRIFRPKTTGSAVVIQKDGQVLLVRNTYGTQRWGFPGGGVKRGEDPALAAAREVQEEVGLTVLDLAPVSCFPFRHHYRNDTVHLYAATAAMNELSIDRAEILEARWFPVEQVTSLEKTSIGEQIWEAYQQCPH
jgi:8-oxo-dGTP diphosphatase